MTKELAAAPDPLSNQLIQFHIDDRTIQNLMAIAESRAMFAKMVDGGFEIDGSRLPSLAGRMSRIEDYLIRFRGPGEPADRLPNVVEDDHIPDGYERRAELL